MAQVAAILYAEKWKVEKKTIFQLNYYIFQITNFLHSLFF